jgi:hypothetical protein
MDSIRCSFSDWAASEDRSEKLAAGSGPIAVNPKSLNIAKPIRKMQINSLGLLLLYCLFISLATLEMKGDESTGTSRACVMSSEQGLVRQPHKNSLRALSYKIETAEMTLEMASITLSDIWGKELFVSKHVLKKTLPRLEITGSYEDVSYQITKALNDIGVSVHFIENEAIALVLSRSEDVIP